MKARIREVCRRRAYLFVQRSALALVFLADEGDEAGDLVAAFLFSLLRWRRKRGTRTTSLSASFIVPDKMHRELLARIIMMYRENRVIGPMFDRLSGTTIMFWNEDGRLRRQFALDLSSSNGFVEIEVAPEAQIPAEGTGGQPGGNGAISEGLADSAVAMKTLNREWRQTIALTSFVGLIAFACWKLIF